MPIAGAAILLMRRNPRKPFEASALLCFVLELENKLDGSACWRVLRN